MANINMDEQDLESREVKNNSNNSSSAYHEDKGKMEERRWTAWLIPMIVIGDIIVFVVAMYINNCPNNIDSSEGKCFARSLRRFSFQPLGENPLIGPSAFTLYKMGAVEWHRIVYEPYQRWRLVTSIWLHAGIIHLVVNMFSLVFIGVRLEQQFGFVRIGIIYAWSGIGGSILTTIFIRKFNVSVGASGALFGLLGAMLSEMFPNWTIYTSKVAALWTLVFIIAINAVAGIMPYVGNIAHIGGFSTGFFLGFILLLRPQIGWSKHLNLPAGARVKSKYNIYQYVMGILSLASLIAGFVPAILVMLAEQNEYDSCHWCRYLTCVPTSSWKCENTCDGINSLSQSPFPCT